MTDSPKATPKRKRGVETSITPIKFSFDPSRTVEDGGNSPRSKVAHKFRGLALEHSESGGGVATAAAHDGDDADSEDSMRKRHRTDVEMNDVPEAVGITDSDGKTVPQPEVVEDKKTAKVRMAEGSIQKAYPSINRLSESKSRGRKKRAGTPPPRLRKKEASDDDKDDEMEIVDPVRAALTWHEDEITIYDPDDADDDGTGINGVGFRPTPALAHARLMKRRQQMAEYRKREESEARARRSQRRQGQSRMTPSPEQNPHSRKVQFMEENNRSYFAMI